MVIGGDGRQYGPVDLALLRQWVTEGRVTWDAKVRNLATGVQMKASNMPELDGYFPPTARQAAAAVASSMYQRPWTQRQVIKNPMGEFWTVTGLSLAGVISGFCLGPFSLPFTGYSLYRAWLAMKDEEQLAGVAFAIAIVAMVAHLAAIGFWVFVLRG
jgi:hypothetical protein